MSRAARRAKDEHELSELQRAFEEKLVAALLACAAGQWGLFGRSARDAGRSFGRARFESKEATELLRVGDEIDAMRTALGYPDGFALYARLREYRRRNKDDDPAEPRLAKEFLAEIEGRA